MDNRPSVETHPAVQSLVNFVRSTKDLGLRVTASNSSEYDWDVAYVSRTALEGLFTPEYVVRLLGAFSYGNDPVYENVDAWEIIRWYSKVFCLLVFIGRGEFINYFVRYGINDQRLPLGPHPPDNFPHSGSDPRFFDRFYEEQWQFCVPELHVACDHHFDPKTILPIRRVKTLGSGGSATAYQVEIHGSYNQLEINSTKQHYAGSSDSCNHPPPKTFVLKCYSGNSGVEKYYDNEWRALKRVHSEGPPCPHIIGFFGSFKLGGVNNVLLEYADQGTLEDYLTHRKPPCNSEDIITFWKSILAITHGLNRIHNTELSTTEGPQIFQGWHHDIKPSNILINSRDGGSQYDFECKLADLGLSHFKRSQGYQAENRDKDPYGTRTYGAPECIRYDSNSDHTTILVTPNADVYSLGCVLSVVATWLVYNWDTVLEYRERRRQEIERKRGFRDGDDFFHNGQDDLLDTVVNHHTELAGAVRRCDYITNSVLSMVKDDMLRPSGWDGRRTARYLQQQSSKILQDAKAQYLKHRPMSSSSGNVSSEDSLWRSHEPVMIPPEPPRINDFLNFDPSARIRYQPNRILRRSLDHEEGAAWDEKSGEHPRPDLGEPEAGQDRIGNSLNRTEFLDVGSKLLPRPLSGKPQKRTPRKSTSADPPFGAPMNSLPEPFTSRPSADLSNLRAGKKATKPSHMTSLSSHVTKDDYVAQYSTPVRDELVPYSPPASTPSTTRTRHPSKHEPSPPVWPVEEALHWITASKDKKSNEKTPNDQLLKNLRGRDHAVLIDNSSSMSSHWPRARSLLHLLGHLIKKHASAGIDLYFTCPFEKNTNLKRTKDMLTTFDKHRASGDHHRSDMSARLSEIVGEYQNRLHKIHERRSLLTRCMTRETRQFSLYVFTDAVWQPVCDVAPVIKSLVKSLHQQNLLKQQIGIEFIRFGDDPKSTKRLEELDWLKRSGHVDIDIVDTEPATGNVWKMLFGSINDWFDDDIPLNEIIPGSSSQ